jgi:hypothetical protein
VGSAGGCYGELQEEKGETMPKCYVCERELEDGQEFLRMQTDVTVPSEEIDEKIVTVRMEFFDDQAEPVELCKNCVVSVVNQNLLELHDASATGAFKIN